MITNIGIERFSLTSSKSFDEVLAAINDAIGHPDMDEFAKATAGARTFAELENIVRKGLGRTGLMTFMDSIRAQSYGKRPARAVPKSCASSSGIR